MGHNRGPALDANDGDPELVFDDRHMQLLRDDKMRNFRIDIETDSTTRADENAEKAAANEFLQTMRQAVEGLAKLPSTMGPMVDPISQTLIPDPQVSGPPGRGGAVQEQPQTSLEQQAQQPWPHVLAYQQEAQGRVMDAQQRHQEAVMDAHLKAVEQISRESDTQVKGDKKTPAARRNATMAVMVEGALRRRLSGLRRTLRRVASPRYRQLRRNLADNRSLMSRLEASRLPNPLPAAHPHRFQ